MTPLESSQALSVLNDFLEERGGRHLKAAEVIVFKAAWEHQTYGEVTAGTQYTKGYIGGLVATRLWSHLSEHFEAKIAKDNMRVFIEERISNDLYSTKARSSQHMKVVGKRLSSTEIFCGRETQIEDIRGNLASSKCILLSGIAGIGKSSLIAKLVEDIELKGDATFHTCAWVTIGYEAQSQYTSIKEIVSDILINLQIQKPGNWSTSNSPYDILAPLENYLRNTSTLIILDGIDAIPDWEEEITALTRTFCDLDHDGCLLMISRSRSKFVHKLKNRRRPVFEYDLKGLDIKDCLEVVQLSGMKDITNQQWHDFVASCRGNPHLILSSIDNIKNWHGGNISSFYDFKTSFITGALDDIYTQYFKGTNRLGDTDKKILDTLIGNPGLKLIGEIYNKINSEGVSVTYTKFIDSLEFLTGCSILEPGSSEESSQKTVSITSGFKDSIQNYYSSNEQPK